MLPKIINPFKWSIWIIIKDIQNYREWIKIINKEKEDPNSLFNKFKMKHNYFYTIYFPVHLRQEDKDLPDNIKRFRIIEMLSPVHRYFDEDLQFAEYIVPEFNQFYDENNEPTLAYGIIYRFAFNKLSIKWVLSRIIFWGGLIWLCLKYPIIEWLKHLYGFF